MASSSFVTSVAAPLLTVRRHTLQLFALAALALAPLAPALADVSAPRPLPKSDVNESSGAFAEVISIEVPDFHDLEPKLGLAYSSAADNSFVGVGWSLTGQSFVERAAPSGGTPAYDASDIFLLDGQELVNCYTFAGTHCPKHHDFRRIKYDAAANAGKGQWRVWEKDGTKSTYNPLYVIGGNTYRWALASEVDTHNNTVTYSYTCVASGYPVLTDTSDNCHLSSVSYNGAVITLYPESRPDPATFATGGTLSANTQRLKSIAVRVGGNLARAYALSYTTDSSNGGSGRSRLVSVKEYGTDATVDAAGAVSGNTSLPAVTLVYQPMTAPSLTNWSGTPLGVDPSNCSSNPDLYYFCYSPAANTCLEGDYNGDGKSDFACIVSGTTWRLWFGTGGNWTSQDWAGPAAELPVSNQCIVGDFDGEGRSDIACQTSNGSGVWSGGLSTGAAFSLFSWAGPAVGIPLSNGVCTDPAYDSYCHGPVANLCRSGDLNGDGKTDFTCYVDTTRWQVGIAAGSGFGSYEWTGPAAELPISNQCLSGDFNGDGKTDITCQQGSGSGDWRTALSTGTSFSTTAWGGLPVGIEPSQGACSDPAYESFCFAPVANTCRGGDFNGDGKSDFTCQVSGGLWRMWMSTGKDWSSWEWNGPAVSAVIGNYCVTGDYNGDGKTDVTCYTGSGNAWSTGFSTGTTFNTVATTGVAAYPNNGQCLFADFNGDGREDMSCQSASGSGVWNTSVSSGTHPDLLTTVNNGMGGSTTVAYTPSSAWSNYNMPVGSVSQTVSSITVNDGRGIADTTTYTYSQSRWSYGLRQPLGYTYNRVAESSGAYTEIWHRQTTATPGVPYLTKRYGSNGALLLTTQKTFNEITSNGYPYTSLVSIEDIFEDNGNSTRRWSRNEYTYDGYGEVTKIIDWGEYLNNGYDNRTFTRSYAENSSGDNYVVLLSEEKTFAGNDVTTGTPLQHRRYYYDNGTTHPTWPNKGDLTKVEDWNNVTNTWVAGTFGYDSYGNQTSTTDSEGRYTTATFSDPATAAYPNVYPVKSCIDPNGLNQCTSQTWNVVLGLPIDTKDPNNAVMRTGYDALGRKISQTDAGLNAPGANVTRWAYFDWGSPTSQGVRTTLPDGSAADGFGYTGLWTHTYFDGLGRPWRTDKEGVTSSYPIQDTIYKDASSKIWKQSNWYAAGATPLYTVMEYDALDRPIRMTHPDGSTVTNVYANDANGMPFTKTTGEVGQEKLTWADTRGNITKVQELAEYVWIEGPPDTTGGDGGGSYQPVYYTTTFEYDLLGHKTRVTDAANNVAWSATYNSLGHKLSETDPNRGTWRYAYYNDGQINTETDAKSQVTTLTYDTAGRPRTKLAGGQTTTWFYDEAGYGASIGRLTRISYPGGSKEMTYNIRGEATIDKRCISGVCRAQNLTYDSLGRPRTLTYPSLGGLPEETVTYAYDAAGNLYSVSGYVSAMTWNAAGQLLSMTYTNGTTNNYTYNTNREWLATANAKLNSTGAILYRASYGYDASARVTSMTQGTPTAVTTSYTYDSVNRLKQIKNASGVVTQSYTYDGIDNIANNSLVGAYTYHATKKHAVTAAGSNSYTYDANGSMLTAPNTTFTWDAENRLASLTRSGVTTSFGYDEDEQRVRKLTGTVSNYYFSKLIEKVGDNHEFYYYAGPILVAKKRIESAANYTRWYHSDRLGSIRLMTSASGVEVKDYDYQPFGATASTTGSASNERGYTGHITDAESNLIYMNARYYDATLGRFISADSIIPNDDEPRDYNRYSYVSNNPLNYTDPTGHGPLAWIAVKIGILVVGATARNATISELGTIFCATACREFMRLSTPAPGRYTPARREATGVVDAIVDSFRSGDEKAEKRNRRYARTWRGRANDTGAHAAELNQRSVRDISDLRSRGAFRVKPRSAKAIRKTARAAVRASRNALRQEVLESRAEVRACKAGGYCSRNLYRAITQELQRRQNELETATRNSRTIERELRKRDRKRRRS
jgi:RHS repeat-associated protein